MLQEHNVLGKRLPNEHIGVRNMVWQRPRQNSGHLEDRTLSDVAEEKTFN